MKRIRSRRRWQQEPSFFILSPISSAVDHPPTCCHCPLVLARHRNKRAGHNTGNQYPVGPTANYPLPTALSVPVWLSTKTRRQTLTTKLTFKKGISQKSVKLDPIYQIPHANRVLLRHFIAGIWFWLFTLFSSMKSRRRLAIKGTCDNFAEQYSPLHRSCASNWMVTLK